VLLQMLHLKNKKPFFSLVSRYSLVCIGGGGVIVSLAVYILGTIPD